MQASTRNTGRAAALLALLTSSGCVAPAPIRADLPYSFVESNETLNYLLRLPADYAASAKTYPLLLFLHGIGQKGDGSAAEIGRVAVDGPFRAMADGVWDDTLPLIVIGPQVGGVQPWWPGEKVRKTLAQALATYRVDPSRIYLTGISMGGRSAWWLANQVPERIAALVPVSAWAGDLRASCERMAHLAVWAFHGNRDPLIRFGSGEKPIDTLSACSPPLEVPPRLTVLDDVGHGQWELVYGNRHGDHNRGGDEASYQDICRWMLSFRRTAATQ